jgi:hypothetical protein
MAAEPKYVLHMHADWIELKVYRAALEKIASAHEPWQDADEHDPREIAQAALDAFPCEDEP